VVVWMSLAVALAAPAPALDGVRWTHNGPATLPRDGTAVVEIWATWCGPCIEQLPHLDTLSATYGDQVLITAVSNEDLPTVRAFWKRQGWAPQFAVGTDPSGKAPAGYMRSDSARGIPRAYIVDDGDIVWSGHPGSIDIPLALVVSDRWSPESQAFLRDFRKHLQSYSRTAAAGRAKEATVLGEQILDQAAPLPSMLNAFAWEILTEIPAERRDRAMALRAARTAVAGAPSEPAYLDTLGLALFESGELAEALDVQRRAVSACDAQGADFCAELRQRLAAFTAAQASP